MKTIDLHRVGLQQILELPDGQGEYTLVIDADQLQLFNLLHQEGVIVVVRFELTDEPSHVNSSNPAVSYRATFRIANKQGVEERLANLDRWTEEHPEYLGDTSEGQTIVVCRGPNICYFGNYLITIGGRPVDMPKGEALLFGLFMNNYGNYISADRILEYLESPHEGHTAAEKSKMASKRVSDLNAELKKLVEYAPIDSHAGRGWVLKFREDAR
jgi:hypothetical protein